MCEDVVVEITEPDIITVETNTLAAEAGAYSVIDVQQNDAALLGSEFCDCFVDTPCVECQKTVIHFDMDNCLSYVGGATSMDYSEFVASYPDSIAFATIASTNVYRNNPLVNKHSCTPGVSGSIAMCVGSLNSCDYSAGSDKSVVFECSILPSPDSAVRVTSLAFYQKAPQVFDWIGGASGLNNHPTLFGVRVLKNGNEIFRITDLSTSVDVWQQEVIDFTGVPEFTLTDSTVLRIELLGYCLIGNASAVDAWDLDEMSLEVGCDAFTGENILISGFVRDLSDKSMPGVVLSLYNSPESNQYTYAISDNHGHYEYNVSGTAQRHYVTGLLNTGTKEGVNTLDLIRMQKHLLGIQPFESPYQYIAADINRSNTLTALDVIELRKLILGKINSFEGNTSWRLGDAAQELRMEAPWDFRETIVLPGTGIDIGNAHLRGVKVGDVTGSIPGVRETMLTTRNTVPAIIEIENVPVRNGMPSTAAFTTNGISNLHGMQLTLDLRDVEFINMTSKGIDITSDNYAITDDGQLSISWDNIPDPVELSDGDVLFELNFVGRRNGMLADFVSRSVLEENIVFDPDERLAHIVLSETGSTGGFLDIFPNPFSEGTTLAFEVEEEGEVIFLFYNTEGRVLNRINQHYQAGTHALWISSDALQETGLIFCHLITGTQLYSGRILSLK